MLHFVHRYVVRKDMKVNVIYVSRQYFDDRKQRNSFMCGPFNWCSDLRPVHSKPLLCKVRHGPHMYECSLRLGAQQEVQQWSVSSGTAQLEQHELEVSVGHQHGNGHATAHHTAAEQLVQSQQGSTAAFQQHEQQQYHHHYKQLECLQQVMQLLHDHHAQPSRQHASSYLHTPQHGATAAGLNSAQTGHHSDQYGWVILEHHDQGLAAGQYAVFYQDGICLGSAKILDAAG